MLRVDEIDSWDDLQHNLIQKQKKKKNKGNNKGTGYVFLVS